MSAKRGAVIRRTPGIAERSANSLLVKLASARAQQLRWMIAALLSAPHS
jgi:hypothetical protein